MTTLKISTLITPETGFYTTLHLVTLLEMSGSGRCLIFPEECFTSHINNQILFYDVYDRKFDDLSVIIMRGEYIQPFLLKSSDYVND